MSIKWRIAKSWNESDKVSWRGYIIWEKVEKDDEEERD